MKVSAKQPRGTIITIVITCIIGMILSIYAYHVEASIHSDPTFKALCDISKKMSCTKVFSSRYGTGFGIMEHLVGKESVLNQPNSIYGMMFYTIEILLATTMSYNLVLMQLIFAILAGGGCVYLAYILVFILDDFCVVCVSTYIVNAVLIICSWIKFKASQNIEIAKKERNDRKKAS